MLIRKQFIDEAECASVAQQVHGLKRFWVKRHKTLPSFTLGASAYLDVPSGGPPQYISGTIRGNKILGRHFGSLTERLVTTLSEALGRPAFLTSRYARPGFHVFGHHPELKDLKPTVHWDLQQALLPDWDGVAGPFGSRCSFTVPLQIPKAGAGLKVWDVVFDPETYKDKLREHLAALPVAETHAYTLGEVFIHSGDLLHQIATDCFPEADEFRMTLQGHGIATDRGWEIYW